MASSQGLTFLSGVASFAALSFYSPSQNLALDPYVHYGDSISDSVGLKGFLTRLQTLFSHEGRWQPPSSSSTSLW